MAIGFSCKCNFKFSLPDEEAGGLIQCPKCGLLNDIPLHQDLASITDEGLYKLDEAPVLDNPEAAAELIYVYTRGALDGRSISPVGNGDRRSAHSCRRPLR